MMAFTSPVQLQVPLHNASGGCNYGKSWTRRPTDQRVDVSGTKLKKGVLEMSISTSFDSNNGEKQRERTWEMTWKAGLLDLIRKITNVMTLHSLHSQGRGDFKQSSLMLISFLELYRTA